MSYATVNGVRLSYESFGAGPPVLLVCGTGQAASTWMFQVPPLVEAGYRVVTFDNRGTGLSEAPEAPYSVPQMASDTAALIEHLDLAPSFLVGYSLGGFVAEELAITRPELLRAAVLMASAGLGTAYAIARSQADVDLCLALDELPKSYQVADLLLSLHSMPELQNEDALVEATIGMLSEAPAWTNPGRLGQYQADLAWYRDLARVARWSDIRVPCLAIAFEHDCWLPPRAVREAARAIEGCEYVEIAGAGHGGPFFKVPEVNAALVAFLDRVASGQRTHMEAQDEGQADVPAPGGHRPI